MYAYNLSTLEVEELEFEANLCYNTKTEWRIGSRVENYLLLQRVPVPVLLWAPISTWYTYIHSGTRIYTYKVLKRFIYWFTYVDVCRWVYGQMPKVSRRGQSMQVEAVVSYPTWILGIKLKPSGRAAGGLSHRATSPAPWCTFLSTHCSFDIFTLMETALVGIINHI